MDRKVPLWLVLLLVWIFGVTTLLFGWSVWYIYNKGGSMLGERGRAIVLSVAKFPTLINSSIQQLSNPPPLIIKDRYPDISGLKLNDKNYTDSSYILLSAYDKKTEQSAVKLLRLSDQKILHQWTPDIDEVIKHRDMNSEFWFETNKGNISLNNPILAADGSIVFNTEDGPLMRISSQSKLIWSLPGVFHHWQNYDADGNIWACATIENSTFLSEFLSDYRDDAIAKVSPDGKLLLKKSISEILLENGYRGLLVGIGPMENDPIHVNDVQPALTTSAYWEKGDVLVSIRNKSTVFLYRPSTNKIIWLKSGPWINQHDVDFIDNSRIGLFGNNIIRNANLDFIDGHNEVYVFDFKTNILTTPYSEFLKKANVSTRTGGEQRVLPDGDLFIEESTYGRLLRGNAKDIVWQFVERIDEKSISLVWWCQFITKDEIKQYTFLKNN